MNEFITVGLQNVLCILCMKCLVTNITLALLSNINLNWGRRLKEKYYFMS